MFSRFFLLSVLTVVAVFVFNSARAEDAAAPPVAEAEQPAEAAPAKEAEDPDSPAPKMRAAIKAVSDGLEAGKMQHFAAVYNNYNMVNTVKMVRGDVSNAIKSCGENNSDMKEELDGRFAKWDEAVSPVIADAEANVNNMVLAQDYVKKEDFQNIFKLIDETRDYSIKKYKKEPVTTKESCGYLLGKMDETQNAMVSLLRAGMMSHPQATAMPPKKEQ